MLWKEKLHILTKFNIKNKDFINLKTIFPSIVELIELSDEEFTRCVKSAYNIKFGLKKLFCIINELIDVDIKKAKLILNGISEYVDDTTYLEEINFLKRKINEKELYFEMSDEKSYIYELEIQSISENIRRRKFDSVYFSCINISNISDCPIVYYYLGKIYFKMYKFEEAKKLFSEYMKHGGEKALKCLLYLSIISNCEGDFESTLKYIELSHKIEQVENRSFGLESMIDEYTKFKKESKKLNFVN